MSDYFFNILTIKWPEEPVTFYFSDTFNGRGRTLYFNLFPDNIEQIFPQIVRNSTNKIYTTYPGQTEGFQPLLIDFQTDNPDLIKRYYNNEINYFFRKLKQQIVRIGFVNENQVWTKSNKGNNDKYDLYDKFSLKVQLCNVSQYPEILLSYDGQTKVSKKSVAELLPIISPTFFNLILSGNKLDKWGKIHEDENLDPSTCFPVINKSLEPLLGIPADVPPRDNRYPKYFKQINTFYKQFLDTEAFQKIIPLNKGGFLTVNPSSIYRISSESNQLLFANNVPDAIPKFTLKKLKPFKKSPYPNIHLFFIVHKDDKQYTLTINSHFEQGFDTFDGMQSYVGLLFHTEAGFSIVFEDKENPIPEIEKKLSERQFDPDVKYMAIYVTPYSKFEKDKQKREIYYQLKEVLLKRNITSQAIDPTKMVQQGVNWKYSLPNIAVAMLAKLDGIPWRLNTPVKNELIVGIGAFKHIDDDVRYIGSAFSFNNNGKFNRFEYFLRDEIGILAGSISDAVRQYATVNNAPERLIIHFYKTMSEEELEPIQQSLIDLKLNIPVFIITINKTESEDIVAFDKGWKELMPLSGIFIGIGNDKFLLFNNTRYSGTIHSKADGYPFPIKLKLQCTVPDLIKDTRIVTELIDQIYQFSRMYWKSIRQQNLPVTIKYPEIIAEIAPHFLGNDIPAYGKDNLWFL